MSPFTLLSLMNIVGIGIPPPDPMTLHPSIQFRCEQLSRSECIITYNCGWCDNNTYINDDDDNDIFSNNTNINGTCINIGYCGIGVFLKERCEYTQISIACFLIKVCLFTFFIIVCINLVYCIIKGIQAPLLKSNYSVTCKRTTVSLLYCLIFIPLVTFYFINFTVFMYMMGSSALLGIIFWCCYGSSAVIKIVNNSNRDYNETTTYETTRLINN